MNIPLGKAKPFWMESVTDKGTSKTLMNNSMEHRFHDALDKLCIRIIKV